VSEKDHLPGNAAVGYTCATKRVVTKLRWNANVGEGGEMIGAQLIDFLKDA
jgi:hypothetical protein